MWDDTDIPLAYLITFRCYGTWLHGDERGSIDRFHNRFKPPYIDPNKRWRQHNEVVLAGEPVTLEASQRHQLMRPFVKPASFANGICAPLTSEPTMSTRVVSIGLVKPERALTAFKANATRQMRQDNCWPYDYSP